MKPQTAGERLFLFIRDEFLDECGSGEMRWSNAEDLFSIMGSDRFRSYIRGAIAVHCLRRLLRFWSSEKSNIANESQRVKAISRFIKEEMLPGIADGVASRLARLVISAENSSYRSIPASERNAVLQGRTKHHCYLCGHEVDSQVPKDEPKHLTYEHLWPTSLGGDSISANLLPACQLCQEDTKDTASWEWVNAHNIVLPPDPSDDCLNSVKRKEKYALHYLAVVDICDIKHWSLKEGFLSAGPIRRELAFVKSKQPLTFFDLIATQ